MTASLDILLRNLTLSNEIMSDFLETVALAAQRAQKRFVEANTRIDSTLQEKPYRRTTVSKAKSPNLKKSHWINRDYPRRIEKLRNYQYKECRDSIEETDINYFARHQKQASEGVHLKEFYKNPAIQRATQGSYRSLIMFISNLSKRNPRIRSLGNGWYSMPNAGESSKILQYKSISEAAKKIMKKEGGVAWMDVANTLGDKYSPEIIRANMAMLSRQENVKSTKIDLRVDEGRARFNLYYASQRGLTKYIGNYGLSP